MSRGDLHEALIEKAAKAINPYLGCCLDCPDADHAARTVLDAIADDTRAEALADLAAAHPVPALTRAMNHARRAEDHWAADTVASLVDALTRCTRSHPTPDRPHPPHPRRGRHRQGGTGRLHHNHTTRDIKQRGECPACDDYHAQREQR